MDIDQVELVSYVTNIKQVIEQFSFDKVINNLNFHIYSNGPIVLYNVLTVVLQLQCVFHSLVKHQFVSLNYALSD